MKRLFIIRHTQKEESRQDIDDYDIHLTDEGLNKAKEIGELLNQKEVKIDLIVSSPAKRTRQTSEMLSTTIDYKKAVMYNEVLYMAFVNELIETLTYTYDNVESMILVGHNPSLTALALTLVDFKEKFEMGGIMEIEFNCDSWIDISKENGTLISYEKL